MFRTISLKLAAGAMAMTMIIVLLLGGVSYLFTRWNLRSQIQEGLRFEASVIRDSLDSILLELDSNVQGLSENLIVVGALVDSAGRDIYIGPFIKSYKLPHELPFILTICDFEGKPIVSSEEIPPSYASEPFVKTVVENERPMALIRTTEQPFTLLISYPIFYGASGLAEGMLVMEVPIPALVEIALGKSLKFPDRIMKIKGKDGEIWTQGTGGEDELLSQSFFLGPQEPLRDLGLTMEYGEPTVKVYYPLRRLTAVYLLVAVAVLFITLVLSRYLARRLTSPLMTLSEIANRVTKTGTPDARIEINSEDEVGVLAASFNTMLEKLGKSHLTLERRVEERTSELAELNRKLRDYADTQSELLREVNHRVKNNLTAIIGMLHQEEDRAQREGESEFVTRLQEVVGRISGLLVVHSLLSSTRWTPLSLTFLSENIIRSAMKGIALDHSFKLEVTAASEVRVSSDQAHYLAIVLNELATNTIKYAWQGKKSGTIYVFITPGLETVELIYRDDGAGYPQAVLAGELGKGSIGLPLIFGITRKSLQGKIVLENDRGARAHLIFPRRTVEDAKE